MKKHYADLSSQPFFAGLVSSIRGDFCIQTGRNLIHGSDSVENAEKEIALWFTPAEVVGWQSCAQSWLYE